MPPLVPAGPYVLAVFGLLAVWLFIGALSFHPSAGTALASNWLTRVLGAVSTVFLPLLLAFFPLYAALRRIKVYEEFVEGAKEAFPVAVRIISFLTVMLAAIGMFRGSGGMDLLTNGLRYVLDPIGFPSDLLPLVLMRPLSGSGSQGLFVDLVKHFGPDNPLTRTAATIYGSTETTFYVVAVYFGAVAVRRTRHAIAAGLIADATGVIASVILCRLLFGPRIEPASRTGWRELSLSHPLRRVPPPGIPRAGQPAIICQSAADDSNHPSCHLSLFFFFDSCNAPSRWPRSCPVRR